MQYAKVKRSMSISVWGSQGGRTPGHPPMFVFRVRVNPQKVMEHFIKAPEAFHQSQTDTFETLARC